MEEMMSKLAKSIRRGLDQAIAHARINADKKRPTRAPVRPKRAKSNAGKNSKA
jgi:hypothetical protein